jgi:hypothetical protein
MRRALLRGRLPAPSLRRNWSATTKSASTKGKWRLLAEKAFEWLDARSGGRRLWLEVATQAWASRST